jgi:hypothetical protein
MSVREHLEPHTHARADEQRSIEMTERILQINFTFNVSRQEYEELTRSLAPAFAEVPGLEWKIWTLNEHEREAGGFYVFDTPESLERFLGSQLAADVQAHPAVTSFSSKTFEVLETATLLTRGPLRTAVAL